MLINVLLFSMYLRSIGAPVTFFGRPDLAANSPKKKQPQLSILGKATISLSILKGSSRLIILGVVCVCVCAMGSPELFTDGAGRGGGEHDGWGGRGGDSPKYRQHQLLPKTIPITVQDAYRAKCLLFLVKKKIDQV